MLQGDGALNSRVLGPQVLIATERYTELVFLVLTPPEWEEDFINGVPPDFLFGSRDQLGNGAHFWDVSLTNDPWVDGTTKRALAVHNRAANSGSADIYWTGSAVEAPTPEFAPNTLYHIVIRIDNTDMTQVIAFIHGGEHSGQYVMPREGVGQYASWAIPAVNSSFLGPRDPGGVGGGPSIYSECGIAQFGWRQHATTVLSAADVELLAGVTSEGLYAHPRNPGLSVTFDTDKVYPFLSNSQTADSSANNGTDNGTVSYIDNPTGVELRGATRPATGVGIDFRTDVANPNTADASPDGTTEVLGNVAASFFRGNLAFGVPDLGVGDTFTAAALTLSFANVGAADAPAKVFIKNADAAAITEASTLNNVGALNAASSAFTLPGAGNDALRITTTDLLEIGLNADWASILYCIVRDDEVTADGESYTMRTSEHGTSSFRPMHEWFYVPSPEIGVKVGLIVADNLARFRSFSFSAT